MDVVTLLAVSIGLQLFAAGAAIRLVRVTKRRAAWILIAVALTLMALRRGVTLWHILAGSTPEAVAPTSVELIAALISLLMALGVVLIAPTFRATARAEQDARRSEARFRHLVENTSDWIWEVNEEPVFTYCSPACRELLGYDPEELVGRHPHSLMPEWEQKRAGAEFERLMAERRPFVRVRNVNLHKDGREIVLETSGVPVFDEQGRWRGYRGIDRDITKEERRTGDLVRLNRVLKVTAECVESIIHAHEERDLLVKVCRVLVETGGFRFVWIGEPEKRPAHTLRPVAHWGEDRGYLDEVRITWDESAEGQGPGGRAVRNHAPVVVSDVRSDPSFAPWREAALARGFESCAAFPLMHKGRLYGIVAIYADEPNAFDDEEVELLKRLTDNIAYGIEFLRSRDERELLATRVRQRQKLEAMGELTAGIAHDFNNLLTVVRANADLLSSAYSERDERGFRENLDELLSAAESATELVRKLLTFGRPDAPTHRPVDLVELLRGQLPLLQRLLSEEHHLEFTSSLERAVIVADGSAVEQILTNLVTNARDAMPSGGVIRVELTLRSLDKGNFLSHGDIIESGPYVCLTVQDSGVGMDEHVKERIFDPFFTTKESGQGTGLGLSVTYGLVRQHGGFIHVDSEVGRGTAMKIYLPLAAEEADASGETAAAGAELDDSTVGPGGPIGGTETILLVDDEASLRRAGRLALKRFGYTVVTAEDGEAALYLLTAGDLSVDAVVADAAMPKMGGPELYEVLRERDIDVPFIIMSGYAAHDVAGDAVASGTLPFVAKPWTVEELVRAVRKALDARDEGAAGGTEST